MYRAAYDVVCDLAVRGLKETAFLLAVIPMLRNRVSRSELRTREQQLVQSARESGVNADSLVMLAALSCLYEGDEGEFGAGRQILKPKNNYDHHDAYNALADLHALELLLASRTIRDQMPLALCTCDKALALFWCGLLPTNVSRVPGAIRYDATFTTDLFPRLEAGDIDRLVTAMAA